MNRPDYHPATWVVAGGRPSEPGAPLNAPVTLASTYASGGERAYAREDGTPTWIAFETLVGGLEDAEAVAFASGMAAIAAVLAGLAPGARIAYPDDCYQGLVGLLRDGVRQGRWSATPLPVDDTEAWVDAALNCDLLWVESPSNPLLKMSDLARIAAAPRRSGALVVVDNTLAGPLAQQPLELGADVVVQSATKLLGGHSDLIAGVVTTRSNDLLTNLRRHRGLSGAIPGSLECYLATRGIRTLAVRHAQAQASAGALAARLREHPAVGRVRYPGFATVISFDVRGGAREADAVCAHLEVVRHTTSFGAVESTIERRAAVAGQEHLPAGLLRLSVGIEDLEDLWADLDTALGPGP